MRGVRGRIVIRASAQEAGQVTERREDEVSRRSFTPPLFAALMAAAFLASAPASGQGPSTATKPTAAPMSVTPPRTPDGHPDLQGIWTSATVAPLERPASV